MAKYIVEQGDCISSIAYEHGFFWDTLWNHVENAQLKQDRKDPNILFPGDEVFIPDKEEKTESCATEQRHRFCKRGVPSKLRLRLLDNDEPRAKVDYILIVDGQIFSGTTDAEGRLEHTIPPNAESATLIIGEEQDEYKLKLGHIDPIDEISGIQHRLNNLGFDCGEVDGVLDEETKLALRKFQKKYEIPETGQPDSETRRKIQELHGS
jgi:hypothetical protein